VPVPDKHAEEPVQEIDSDLYVKWLRARANAAAWKAEEDRFRAILEDSMGDATAGTVEGMKVVGFRPSSKWATKRLMEDYPDLANMYIKRTVVDEFDMVTFRKVHPEIANKYQVRAFRNLATLPQEEE
jgi:hypothetical protein